MTEFFEDGGVPGWRVTVNEAGAAEAAVEVYTELFCFAEGPVLALVAMVRRGTEPPVAFHAVCDLGEAAGQRFFFALARTGQCAVEITTESGSVLRRTATQPDRSKIDRWLDDADRSMNARPPDSKRTAADAYGESMAPFAAEGRFLDGWDALEGKDRPAGAAAPPPIRAEGAFAGFGRDVGYLLAVLAMVAAAGAVVIGGLYFSSRGAGWWSVVLAGAGALALLVLIPAGVGAIYGFGHAFLGRVFRWPPARRVLGHAAIRLPVALALLAAAAVTLVLAGNAALQGEFSLSWQDIRDVFRGAIGVILLAALGMAVLMFDPENPERE